MPDDMQHKINKATSGTKSTAKDWEGGDPGQQAKEWGGGSKGSKGPITEKDKHNPNSSSKT